MLGMEIEERVDFKVAEAGPNVCGVLHTNETEAILYLRPDLDIASLDAVREWAAQRVERFEAHGPTVDGWLDYDGVWELRVADRGDEIRHLFEDQ